MENVSNYKKIKNKKPKVIGANDKCCGGEDYCEIEEKDDDD